MENKSNKQKENRSMYIYTALIFVVALILIFLAFFGQTNISRLGNRANEFTAEPTPVSVTDTPSETVSSEEFANISNMASSLDLENKELKSEIDVYELLADAFAKVNEGYYDDALEILTSVDQTTLTDSQKILYDELTIQINERKDQ